MPLSPRISSLKPKSKDLKSKETKENQQDFKSEKERIVGYGDKHETDMGEQHIKKTKTQECGGYM